MKNPQKPRNLAAALTMILCAVALCVIRIPSGLGPRLAWICSLLCLALSVFSSRSQVDAPTARRSATYAVPRWMYHHTALLLGVSASIVLTLQLIMRSVYVGIDLLHGYPWQGIREFGFSQAGLWTIAALCLACIVALQATRDGRLLTVQFWLLVLFAAWASLLSDPFQSTKTGGFERNDATLILVECLAFLVLLSVVVVGWVCDCGCLNVQLPAPSAGSALSSFQRQLPAGFRSSVAALLLGLNIAVVFHILVPAGESTTVLRMSGFRAGIAAFVAATGGLFLLRRTWGAHLADASLGLLALTLCGLATAAVPSIRVPLDQRYPMIFNAITLGYAFAAGIFAHWSQVWGGAHLDTSMIRARIVPHLNRFAFFCGAAALLSGVMMCFWPGLPGISAMDHTLGRVLAGFAAFLFLLLVTLRSSRLLHRMSFHFLTVAVAASMVAFLVIRALPFASDISH